MDSTTLKKTDMNHIKLILTGLIVALVAGACKEPDYGTPTPSSTVNYAQVLYINAAPDAGTQPFLENNASVASVGSPGASLYLPTIANAQQFRLQNVKFGVVGKDTVKAKSDLFVQSTLVGGSYYTVILTDTLARPFTKGKNFSSDQGGLRFLGPMADVLTAPTSGNSGIRFLNLAPGAPAVYITASGNTITGVTASRSYRTTTGFTAFSPIAIGTYTLEVRSGSVTGTIIASVPFTLADGKLYTVYLSGQKSGNTQKVPYAVNVVQHN
jgi:Domain of unknown function (DUF4397)